MASIPFAFSVHHFINSVGAYAGFAAIIGLAILVLLYFAQARETSSLREQAFESAQRVQQLENRLAQLSRMQAAPPVQAQSGVPARPVAAPAHAAAAATATVPPTPDVGAPAGVGAPALTAATKLIPAGAVAAGVAAFQGEEPDLTTVGSPAPATVAGGANGHATTATPPIGPSGGGQRGATDPGTMEPPPRVQIRPGAATVPPGRRPAPTSRKPARQGPSTGRRVAAAVLALLVIAGVVVALLVLTSSSSNTSTSTQAANKSKTTAPKSRHRKTQTAAFSPSSVTVSVLNGTATAQLAHRVATKLTGLGYKEGNVRTAADQTRTATVVAYLPGHQRAALEVAKSLKLGPASVQPIDQNTQAVACDPGTACAAGVVVTVGSDLANIQ
jgi:hypothetical protein